MPNAHGEHIWYELSATDSDRPAGFYSQIFGWTMQEPMADMGGYRLFGLPSVDIGGIMPIPPGSGMQGGWVGYIAVDDVDHTAARAVELGGSQCVEPTDIPGVGRFAVLADPDGGVFQIMRGASDEVSRSYDPNGVGHCRWNELSAANPANTFAFYSALFGWTKGESMDMGDMGEYQFIDQAGKTFGAIMHVQGNGDPGWCYYFGVADMDVACEKIRNGGGKVKGDLQQIPGGEFTACAEDPDGSAFALVGPRKD